MHDTYLLNKISKALEKLCKENDIRKINQFTLVVNHNSHVNQENLRQHLEINNKNIIGDDLQISLQRDDIADQTAIIYSLQGETNGR